MKYILLLLFVVGLGLGGQCFEREENNETPNSEEQAAALKQAKTEAQDIANKAIGWAILVKTNTQGYQENKQEVDTLQAAAEDALKKAKDATTKEEADTAKKQAQDTYDKLDKILKEVTEKYPSTSEEDDI